jgi:hypothetical protein
MAGHTTIFFVDIDGKHMSVAEVAKKINCKEGRVRSIRQKYGYTTVEEIVEHAANLEKSKMFYSNVPLHDTIHGMLTVRGIHKIHPYRDTVSQATISQRIQIHGPRGEGLWGPIQKNTKRSNANVAAEVQVGDIVISGNLVYKVAECLEDGTTKPLISGNRVMPNGQVLKNTTKYLGTDWQKAPCRH